MSNPLVLVIDDEKAIRFSLDEYLRSRGYDVVLSDGQGDLVRVIEEKTPDVVLLDLKLPDQDGLDLLPKIMEFDPQTIVMMMTGYSDIETAIAAMKRGAYDYIQKPFNLEEMTFSIAKALEARSLKKEVGHIRQEQRKRYKLGNIIGVSPEIHRLNELVERVAQSKASTVLIQGDSGTGKSLVARVIHYSSVRSDKPFVEVNCTALPESLLESELFGHEKGAFTDAKRHKEGLFELSDGGTLFLDEIGEMTTGMQSKLLKAIEEKSFRRVGGIKEYTVNTRIIAATNKNLELAVEDGQFREDLYYRLKVMPIYMGPLRNHKEDLPHLVNFFIAELNREFKSEFTGITPETERKLFDYDWPGNVREVRNVIERAMILGEAPLIEDHYLLLEKVRDPFPRLKKQDSSFSDSHEVELTLDSVEKQHIIRVLNDTNWNRNKTARLLNINRTTLYNKIDKYNLDKYHVDKIDGLAP